ncbi:polynucleotide kinase [Gordonia phage Sour]|uniref:Polynucleotide kinase n=1 Tax=Gordonia phage Sour TaxID=2182349 RepID=A0A2U8UKM5_9CAUD|nr:polynucleotide kinase [Gordonia phage Sour]AWN04259.1 polynucleotide kinase [Gordonia phage Sour]
MSDFCDLHPLSSWDRARHRRDAVIVDVDGTLCDVSTILHHLPERNRTNDDYRAFHEASRQCPPNEQVLLWCDEQVARGRELIVVTGRKYTHGEGTIAWLDEHMRHNYHGPFMRGDDDRRADTEVKADIARQLRDDHGFNVVAAIDDRPSVIRLWHRQLGIPTTVVYRRDWLLSGEHYTDLLDLEWI